MDYFYNIWKPDNLTLIISNIILVILFLVAAYFGPRLKWYQDLPNKTNDTIYLAVAWVIGSILSYSAFYLIKDIDEQIFHTSRLLPWFVLINFINLLWVVVFYIYKSFTAAAILILSILLIEFYIILLLLYVNVYAALLNLPIFILYIY